MAGIIGLSGQPGAGKSYSVVELFVLPSLRENRKIITNVPLKMDAIIADFPKADIEHITDLKTVNWSEIGGGCILIIDEVWRLWQQGTKLNNIPEAQLSLLKEHRHRSDDNGRSMDIVLISQDMGDICSPVRMLIESTVVCCKHLDLGREDAFIRYYCRNAASIDVRTNAPKAGQIMKSENGRYLPEVYKYYKSHMQGTGAAPVESRVVKTTIFGYWKWKAGVVVVVCCLFAIVWGSRATAEKMHKMTHKTDMANIEPVSVVSPAQSSEKPQKQETSDMPLYSVNWRIAGYIKGTKKGDAVILASLQKAQRIISIDRCKVVDFEQYCTVDGEVVTAFSGRQQGGYLADEKKPVEMAKAG